jgi:hypothetical protein
LKPRRDAYDLDHDADCLALQIERYDYWRHSAQKRLWKKHGLNPLYRAVHREDTKIRRIVKAIRKAKAESLFGIGVKLSAWEDWDGSSEEEFAEVVDGVRRDIAGADRRGLHRRHRRAGSMTALWFTARLWLANRLLDAVMWLVPPAERERLRRMR